MVEMKVLGSHEEWLRARTKIGGSDASAIVGMNPYKTNVDLFKEKAYGIEPEDISDKGSVQLEGSTIMLIAEMITAISGVRSIVEEDFGTDVANQFIDKAVEIVKQNNSEIDILELATELAEVRENGSK